MMPDGKKNVLLAVSGSIAAYKACDIARAFIKEGVSVTVTLTPNGAKFVTPVTFETLTGSKCLIDTFDRNFKFEVEHIAAAKAADVCLIAPASADIIGKIANGIADDMATTTIMAATCPKLIAPAMNTAMYDNPIVQENLAKLVRYGYMIITPDTGLLACGDVGRGKLAPVETIVDAANEVLQEGERPKDLAGKKVLVTAGPTQEAIDPVRYITNHSSGKMGYALAEAARDRGADVVLVSGQVALAPPSGVTVRKIVSAADMAEAVFAEFDETDVLIMAAAVADYRPKEVADQKIKKSGGGMTIELERTTDILGTLAEKKTHQFVCGFSMETENLIENSRKKLEKKKLDMIAANSIRDEGAGFAHDTNKVTVITKEDLCDLPLTSKAETAHLILDEIVKRI
jgi:phosphopantothenoylcysteine decarboxylase/phosphopantothenate--cysteine ligase